MVDLHCHIMPYVDDGAAVLDEAMEMLRAEAKQGVTDICLTPHMRVEMFCTPDKKINAEYKRLCQKVKEERLPLRLYVSREYFYDSEFCRRLETKQILPMGECATVLVEFNYSCSANTLREAAARVIRAGYNPMFAHVERYAPVQKDLGIVKELVEAGVMIQVNADSLLGLDGKLYKRTAWALLRKGYVHVVATDAHDVQTRPPRLRQCAKLLAKEIGTENTLILLERNPMAILKG